MRICETEKELIQLMEHSPKRVYTVYYWLEGELRNLSIPKERKLELKKVLQQVLEINFEEEPYVCSN